MQCLPVAAPGDPGPRSIFVQSAQVAELIPRLDGLVERVALHVLGREEVGASAAPGTGRAELDDLRRRVDALERRAAAIPASTPKPEPKPQP